MIFPFRNVRDVLGLHAKVSSHKTALISYDAQHNRLALSYLEFVGKTHQIANFLYEDLNIQRGDTIAITSSNRENALLLYFATWVIGAAVLSVDSKQDEASMIHALKDNSARIFFAEYALVDKYLPIVQAIDTLEGLIQIGGEARQDTLRLEDLAANRPTTFLGDESGAKGADIPMTGVNERTARLRDIALVTYRDGLAIQQTQGDLLHTAYQLAQARALTGNQTALATLDLHENFAASIMAPLSVGATLVLTETVDPDFFWHTLVKETVHTGVLNVNSIQSMVGTAQQHMLAGKMRFGGKIIQQDVKHFRHILITDTKLTSQLACDFEDTFGIPLINSYQHPQTAAFLTLLPITLAWKHHQQLLHGYDTPSIGMALTKLSVLDDDGKALAENQIGRIAIKQADDWLATGDTGYFILGEDSNSFYFLS